MAESRFIYVIYIRTTAEQLWQALTEPEFTRQYWAECWHDCAWTKGAEWKLMIKDGRVGDIGRVLEINPPHKLVLSWTNVFIPEMAAEGESIVTFDLTPEGTSIRLTVTHVMNRADSCLIAGVSQGWPHILSSLKTLLETGESLVETRIWPDGV